MQKCTTEVQEALRAGLADQDPETRVWARKAFWALADQFKLESEELLGSLSLDTGLETGSLASSRSGGSLSCKTRSSISIPSISSSTSGSTSSKTPKGSRRASNVSNGNGNGGERMITIKCGRLNEDKTYEEIEVEVPAPIYDTIQLYNDASSASPSSSVVRGAKERRSLGSKLRNLFTSNKI